MYAAYGGGVKRWYLINSSRHYWFFRSDEVIEPLKNNTASGRRYDIKEREKKNVKKRVISSPETNYGSASKEILKVLGECHSNSLAMMEGAHGSSPLVRFF